MKYKKRPKVLVGSRRDTRRNGHGNRVGKRTSRVGTFFFWWISVFLLSFVLSFVYLFFGVCFGMVRVKIQDQILRGRTDEDIGSR